VSTIAYVTMVVERLLSLTSPNADRLKNLPITS
jgi:hypothetical protein